MERDKREEEQNKTSLTILWLASPNSSELSNLELFIHWQSNDWSTSIANKDFRSKAF